jgi:tRNA(Ile)-lysidine synthase TilS/MesJ
MTDFTICSTCVLPSNFPGLVMQDGICNFCLESSVDMVTQRKTALEAEIRSAIDRSRNIGEYDCIVAFSGGKDSTYTLKLLVETFALNCLAVTIDNGFISPQAWKNCKTVTTSLNVDFLCYAPAFGFMKTMYTRSATLDTIHPKSAIKRASSMCNSCINLINNYVLKIAVRHEAPLIAGGYIGGQVPRDAAVVVFDTQKQQAIRTAALRKNVENFGTAATRYFGPITSAGGHASVTIINPLIALTISETEIIADIRQLGWEPTRDTGQNSSNCLLNDVGILVHHKKHSFHPYAFEVSEQVRAGLMSRDDGLRKIGKIPSAAHLSEQLSRLGLNVDAL